MFSVGLAEHVPCVFDHSVLKASASADERNILLAREPDCVERALHAAIRTSWRAPQPVIATKPFLCCRPLQVRRWQPLYINVKAQPFGGAGQRGIGLDVRLIVRVEVADDSDLDWLCHVNSPCGIGLIGWLLYACQACF